MSKLTPQILSSIEVQIDVSLQINLLAANSHEDLVIQVRQLLSNIQSRQCVKGVFGWNLLKKKRMKTCVRNYELSGVTFRNAISVGIILSLF